jgi:hypothetical protein
MTWKRLTFLGLLALALPAATGCRRVPTAPGAHQATWTHAAPAARDDAPSLHELLRAFERQPTLPTARAISESLLDLQLRIRQLESIVARTSGGPRAEAEVERVELSMLHEEALSHLSRFRARLAWEEALTGSDADGAVQHASMPLADSGD